MNEMSCTNVKEMYFLWIKWNEGNTYEWNELPYEEMKQDIYEW